MDHIRRGSLKLDSLRAIVLDEADEMLRMGFAEDVDWILTQSPAQRQIALFSATMPDAIRRIAQRHLRNPAEVTIKQATSTAATVKQRYVVAAPHQKQNVLGRLLEAEPIDAVLIFVNTKSLTEPLAEYLSSQGHRTAALSSDVAQNQRERIVDNLRSGKIDVIIATDVAARGLDVQRISHVINYDFPTDSENYVHRIGRTGRAGRSGHAILFSHPRGRHLMKRLEQATRQTIEAMDIPSADAINERRIARFHQKITDSLAHPELETFTALIEQYRAQNDVPPEMVAAALAVLASGDTPLLLVEEANENDFPNFRDGGARQNGRERSNDGDRWNNGPAERGERGPVGRRGRGSRTMETFRIEVGLAHQVKATNIVGAIANETGLDSSIIGKIEIFDEHSTVDLLAGMPRQVFDALRNIKIAGRRLNITRAGEEPDLETGIIMADHGRATARVSKPAAAGAKPRAEAKEFAPAERKGRSLVKKFKAKPKSKRATAKS
jgi:ATP-dependent RNA helicase DeaD